jgi:hypothetical protein
MHFEPAARLPPKQKAPVVVPSTPWCVAGAQHATQRTVGTLRRSPL